MTIKIICALLILLMSLAGCSGDRGSRLPTAKLSSGSEGNSLLCRNNSASDPLQVCSPAADLHTTDDEEEDREETARRARQAEEARKEQLRQEQLARERQTAANARTDADVLARAQARAERGDQQRKYKYAQFELDQRQKMFAREAAEQEAARKADIRESIRKAEEAREASRQASADIRESIRKAQEARAASRKLAAVIEAERKAEADREAEREAQEQAAPRIEAHIKQIYGPASTATEAEKMEDLENYGYTKLQLRHIVMELNRYFKHNTPLYKRLSQKISEMPKDMFD